MSLSSSSMIDQAFHDPVYSQGVYLQCKYPGKFCHQSRARKRNGELHRFCEEHRAKANNNQKRWNASRQQLQQLRYEPYSSHYIENGNHQIAWSLVDQPNNQLQELHDNDDAFDCGFQAHEFDELLSDLVAATAQEEPPRPLHSVEEFATNRV